MSRPVTGLLILLFFLNLPLALLYELGRAILNELALVVDAIPLRFPVRDIDDATLVEHVATK